MGFPLIIKMDKDPNPLDSERGSQKGEGWEEDRTSWTNPEGRRCDKSENGESTGHVIPDE